MGLATHIRHHLTVASPLSAGLARSRRWAERAQDRARRNAMVATNELMARRHEREEVEEFLLLADARHLAAAGHRRQADRPRPAAALLPSEHRPAAAHG